MLEFHASIEKNWWPIWNSLFFWNGNTIEYRYEFKSLNIHLIIHHLKVFFLICSKQFWTTQQQNMMHYCILVCVKGSVRWKYHNLNKTSATKLVVSRNWRTISIKSSNELLQTVYKLQDFLSLLTSHFLMTNEFKLEINVYLDFSVLLELYHDSNFGICVEFSISSK